MQIALADMPHPAVRSGAPAHLAYTRLLADSVNTTECAQPDRKDLVWPSFQSALLHTPIGTWTSRPSRWADWKEGTVSNRDLLISLIAVVILVAVVVSVVRHRGPQQVASPDAVNNIVTALLANSLGNVQQQCSQGLVNNAHLWLPQVSAALNGLGGVQSVEPGSCDTPSPGWAGQNFIIHCERGSYEMRIERRPDGLIGHLGFRTSPSEQWYP